MFNYIILILVFIIAIIISIFVWYFRNKNSDSRKNVKLENIQNTNNEQEKEKSKMYNKMKKKIYEIIIKKYTFDSIKDNPKLKSNFESITNCVLNKILKYIDMEKAYFDIFENFENVYKEVYKKDPTIYNCFNEKQLKAIKFLRDRISNTDLDSIIDYVKKNIYSNFTSCEDNNCFSDKEYIILNNFM